MLRAMELVLALADGTLDPDEDEGEGDPVVWDEGTGDELGSIDATSSRARDDLVASTT